MSKTLFLILSLIILSCNNPNSTKQFAKNELKKASGPNAKALYFSDSSYSSIILKRNTVNGHPSIEEISHSQSYHFVSYPEYFTGGMWVRHALINEVSIQHCLDAPNYDKDGEIFLKANVPNINPIQDTCNLYKIDWSDSIRANEIHYTDLFIEALLNRDTEKPVKKILNYTTGKKIIEISSRLYGLQHPNGIDRRYMGYLEKPNVDNHSNFDTIPNLYGVLSYANPITEKTQFLILRSKNDFDLSRFGLLRNEYLDDISLEGVHLEPTDNAFKMENSELIHWDYSDFKRFYIVLTFKGDYTNILKVPIINDRIDNANLHSKWFDFELK